jgi:hypothetical protein
VHWPARLSDGDGFGEAFVHRHARLCCHIHRRDGDHSLDGGMASIGANIAGTKGGAGFTVCKQTGGVGGIRTLDTPFGRITV